MNAGMNRKPVFQNPMAGLLVALVILFSSGCGLFGGKSVVINKAIEALESKKSELLGTHPEIADAKFYKDEQGDGIVIEYIYKDGTRIDPSFTADAAKTNLIAQFKDNEGIKTILGYGVYLRFMFKTADGETVADTKLESSDL